MALWRLTLLPLTTRILGAVSAHLRNWWPGLEISVDRDAVPALSEDLERPWLWQRDDRWPSLKAVGHP